MRKAVFLICALVVLPVFAGPMYEWKDPATGKLMLGDKPPQGVPHWPEGAKPPEPQTPVPARVTAPNPAPQPIDEEKARADRWAEMDRKRQEKNEAAELLRRSETPKATQVAFDAIFDIEAHCKKVSQAVGGSYQIEQTCRDQERKAQSNISIMAAPPEIVAHCKKVGSTVGGSYQIMETCIEQEIKAKANLR